MKFNFRNLFAGLVIIIVLAFVFLRGDQLNELATTMAQGAMIPLVIAILTQLCKYFSQSFAYKYSFQAVGETMHPKNTLPLVFGTFFLNTVFPSLNLAGTTLVVDDARRRGIAPGKATSAALLMQITVDSAFATIMIISFAILALTVGLSPVWLLLGLIVILLVSCMIGIIALGNKNPELLIRILTPIASLINKVLVKIKKKPLNPWVEKTVMSFSSAAKLILKNPKSTAKAFGCSIIASCCELSAFALVGFSFGVSVPESLVCGYVVATLFAMISITPQGVGVVEAAVTVAFTAFGASATAGMAIGLVYRGIVFWMPFIIGAILIQTTKTFRPESNRKKIEKTPTGNFNYEREQAELNRKTKERFNLRNNTHSHSKKPNPTCNSNEKEEVENA
ncbi:MAG TPA: flippase-like domain-containing protein [Eggerthellaceae bacterium]|nr:flippase-like domain-containing protein [Eggerthellaceae bacterium]